jgi:hypothetical protein
MFFIDPEVPTTYRDRNHRFTTVSGSIQPLVSVAGGRAIGLFTHAATMLGLETTNTFGQALGYLNQQAWAQYARMHGFDVRFSSL